MYISRVRLRDIRCFEKLDLRLSLAGPTVPWTLILGDNATGKTVLLRSIALALCDEPSAAGLIKESEEGYIRRGAQSGSIFIYLKQSPRSEREFKIRTYIRRVKIGSGEYEAVSKPTKIAQYISWERVFVCGYGAGRGTSGSGDVPGYSALSGVYSLFNYNEGLQNPELMLRRLKDDDIRQTIINFMGEFLLRGTPSREKQKSPVELSKKGISLSGPWGKDMAFRDLSDGYKSSFLWLTDFLGWAVSRKKKFRSIREISGILLIDEIEQHLHPSWQYRIIKDLREFFPKVQFISTTHSPLVVAGGGQLDSNTAQDNILYLERQKGSVVATQNVPTMRGWGFDQILGSSAFNYVTPDDPEINRVLREASRLLSKKGKLNQREGRRLKQLRNIISKNFIVSGSTEVERKIEEEIYNNVYA